PGMVPDRSASSGALLLGSSSRLRLGKQFRITGMTRKQELNGAACSVVKDSQDEFGRVYVQLRSSNGKGQVLKVLASCLEPDEDGEDSSLPTWMPRGFESHDPLGSSCWSATGMRVGFIGFGLIHEKCLSQSTSLKLPPPSGDLRSRNNELGHKGFRRNALGNYLAQAPPDF
ncbi:unnamed protein product, partial [Polarella glacialis]